ncbi:MAG TPA: hypothetical protein VF865_08030 [Acidobacteriaceae bacterium]
MAAFAPVLLAPGYCLAWACNFLGFRKRPFEERLAWGITLSFGVVPIVAVELGKYASLSAVCRLASLCGVAFLAIAALDILRRERGNAIRWPFLGAAIGAAWALFVVAALIDVGVGDRLYLSVTVFDHALRTAFVDAVMRTGVPPANPLFWPGHATPMRYYYFWYVLTAVAARLGGTTARQAMIASVAWSGLGLAAVLSLYCRHFLGTGLAGENPFRSNGRRLPRYVLALALLAVTGLDILPAIVKAILRMPTDPDMEWWSSDQVTSWVDSVIWVPHHVAGLVCCLFGFLLVWMSKGLTVTQRCLCGVIAGVSFASAFGLSTWVPLAFALVLLAWMLWALAWATESRERVPILLGAGLVAVLALLPYLHELRATRSARTTALSTWASVSEAPVADGSIASDASHLLRFGFRRMIDIDGITGFGDFTRLHPVTGPIVRLPLRLFLLLPGYFIELGFFGLVLVIAVRALGRSKLDEPARTSLFLVAAALVVTTCLRSTVIDNNDFGWRSMLIAQFFLLLLAVLWREGTFGPPSRAMRTAMQAMLWIGLAGTVYQAVGLRIYLPMEEKLGRPDERGLAERTMALRRGFEAMDQRIAKDAVIQFNTAQPSEFLRYAQVMHAGRQTATAMPGCAAAFGGDPARCAGVERGVAALFSADKLSGAMLSAAQAREECGALGVNYLVATRWDAVWQDSRGWVWTLPAVTDTGDVRAVECSAPAR